MYHMNKKQEANAFVKECITKALFQMMKTQSFESISITDLTKKAGVGRVSFYRNFESKEDIISQYLTKITKEWNEEFENEPSQKLIESLFTHFKKHKDIFILIYKADLWHLSLEGLKKACGPKPEQANHMAYRNAFIAYGLYGWVEEWFKRGMEETPKEMQTLVEKGNYNHE